MTAHYLQLRYLNCWLACAKAESDNRCAMKPKVVLLLSVPKLSLPRKKNQHDILLYMMTNN